MTVEEKIELLQELVQCNSQIYTWCYDREGSLLHSNCPEEKIFSNIFSMTNCKDEMLRYGHSQSVPVSVGTEIGLNWSIAFQWNDTGLVRCYVLGPVFYQEMSPDMLTENLSKHSGIHLSPAHMQYVRRLLPMIPVAQTVFMQRYLLMLNYCITGVWLHAGDINYREETAPPLNPMYGGAPRNRDLIYRKERELLDTVRTGNLQFQKALGACMELSSGVPVKSRDALRSAKTSLTVFVSLVCRASIEGGLTPEEAYSLGDQYIQSVESAKTSSELMALSPAMYQDFVFRVHKHQTQSCLSPEILRARDYIHANLDKRLLAADVAAQAGYAEYYLSQKFHKEMGTSLNDYIKETKIARAKVLLRYSDQSIQDIAGSLAFSSRSYFSQVFTQMVGVSPAQYRAGKD